MFFVSDAVWRTNHVTLAGGGGIQRRRSPIPSIAPRQWHRGNTRLPPPWAGLGGGGYSAAAVETSLTACDTVGSIDPLLPLFASHTLGYGSSPYSAQYAGHVPNITQHPERPTQIFLAADMDIPNSHVETTRLASLRYVTQYVPFQ